MSSSQIFELFQLVYKSRKYLLEMLNDRGFDISSIKNYTEDEIKDMLTNHNLGKFETLPDKGPLDILLEKNTGTQHAEKAEKIYVKFRLDNKFKATASLTTQINDIYSTILTTKDTLIIMNVDAILIKVDVKEKVDEEYANQLYITKNYFVQLYGLSNFLFNVSNHITVPKHRIMSKIETQQLLTTYNCNISNLPTIKRDDPQSKYIGLKPKQVCEILSPNVSSGITKKYKVCEM